MGKSSGNIIEKIQDVISGGCGREMGDDDFNELALEVFSYQFEKNLPYRQYCLQSDKTPENVNNYKEIPAVPTSAFKVVTLACFSEEEAVNCFHTSGTTEGIQGRHFLKNYQLYNQSLLETFSHYMLPDEVSPEFIILSVPPYLEPNSSLIHMFEIVRRSFGREKSDYYMDKRGINFDRLERRLTEIQSGDTPICFLGTSLAYLYFIEWCRNKGKSFPLPSGSRIMDTGGTKGKVNKLERTELLEEYSNLFGIPQHSIVNEYGMTELLSQYYDCSLRMYHKGEIASSEAKMGPPWLRTISVDPESLEPLPDGSAGLLVHIDLANVDSVSVIQAEDIGVLNGARLMLQGRILDSPARGCSLTIEEIVRNA